MKKSEWKENLRAMSPCCDAMDWAEQYETFSEAWRACPCGDWMLWLAVRKCERKKVVLAACECARLALPYAKGPRAKTAIETAEKWCRGEATPEEVRLAAEAAAEAAAYAAAHAAHAADAADAYAADAAAEAADAAYAAAYAADDAADAAYAAAYAAADAADAAYAAAYAAAVGKGAERTRTLKKCAAIVRKHFKAKEVEP